jgi:hypothetical protein
MREIDIREVEVRENTGFGWLGQRDLAEKSSKWYLESVNVGSHDGIYRSLRNMLLGRVFSIVLTNFDVIFEGVRV